MTDPTFVDRLRIVAATPFLAAAVLLASAYVAAVRAAEIVGGLDTEPIPEPASQWRREAA